MFKIFPKCACVCVFIFVVIFFTQNASAQTEEYYTGVGLQDWFEHKNLIVVDLLPGAPAERAGVKINDEIIEVDGESVNGKHREDISMLLRGEQGTKVTVVVFRPDTKEKHKFQIAREIIKMDYAKEIERLTQRLKDYPKHAAAYHNNIALFYQKQGLHVLAIDEFTKVIQLEPMTIDAYISRGISYESEGSLFDAIRDNTKAIEIDPAHPYPYNNRCHTHTCPK